MRVAVIGSGVTGLGATWALNEHSEHDVVLFESAERVGGHTNTVHFEPKGKRACDVDTGFIVFNEVTYPNLLRFLRHIEVRILSSDMSFAVSRTAPLATPRLNLPFSSRFPSLPTSQTATKSNAVRGAFEWAGKTPASLFCQPSNLLSPAHWRMVCDIIRFNYQSLDTLRQAEAAPKGSVGEAKQTIGDWLDERGYGDSFRRNYLIPMTASIWSTPLKASFNLFPALTLLRFMHNHHLLQLLDRPTWLTISGGSHNYVKRVLKALPEGALRLGKKAGAVSSARQEGKQWIVKTESGEEKFDKVIFACHADTTRQILQSGGTAEKDVLEVLGQFEFNQNEAVLHSDEKLLPVRQSAWSAWNFLATSSSRTSPDEDRVTLTYWMNLLQSLPEQLHGHVLVTLNPSPDAQPRSELIKGRYSYTHPLYTPQSVAAQAALKPLQGREGAHYCGAWTAYGFHEDGFSSGLRAAVALGAQPPFEPKPAERDLPKRNANAYRAINAFEYTRGALAPIIALTLAPLIIVATLCLEAVVSALTLLLTRKAAVPCAFRNAFREIRATWEEELQHKWGLLKKD